MGIAEPTPNHPPASRVPRNEIELGELLRELPPAWEYLLFAAELKLAMDAIDDVFHQYEAGKRLPRGELVEEKKTASFLARGADDVAKLISGFASLRRSGIQERAFGGFGTQSDARKIAQLAKWWNSTYEGLLEWSMTIRNTRVSVRWQAPLMLLASLADRPILAYRSYVQDFHARADSIPATPADGKPYPIDVELTLSIDQQLSRQLSFEIERTTDEYVRDLLKRHR